MGRLTFIDPLNDAPEGGALFMFRAFGGMIFHPNWLSVVLFLQLLDSLDAGQSLEDAPGVGGNIVTAR